MPTETDCKRLIFKAAISLGASDKHLMLDGEIDEDVLRVAVKCWMDAGVPNYAEGSSEPIDWGYYKPQLKER